MICSMFVICCILIDIQISRNHQALCSNVDVRCQKRDKSGLRSMLSEWFLLRCRFSLRSEILEQTKFAWLSLDRKVFEAAWLTCGYFSIDYFKQFRQLQTDGVSTMEEVADCVDPAQVLAGGHILRPTPQFCQVFEWQIQDSCFQTN